MSLRLLLRLQFPAVTSGDEVLGVSQSFFVWHFYKVSVVSEWPTTPRCLEENKGLGDSELSLWFPHFVSVHFFTFRSFHFCIFHSFLHFRSVHLWLRTFLPSRDFLKLLSVRSIFNASPEAKLGWMLFWNHIGTNHRFCFLLSLSVSTILSDICILSFFSFLSFFCMLILFHCFSLRFSLWTKPLQTVNSHYRNCDSSGKQLATTAYSSSQHHKQPCW